MNIFAGALDDLGMRIDFEVGNLDAASAMHFVSSDQCFYSCEELASIERFREIIVGTAFQTADTIIDRISRGEHEDGSSDLLLSQSFAHRPAIHFGEHDIENDQARSAVGLGLERFDSVSDVLDGVALSFEDRLDLRSDDRVVFYEKDAHCLEYAARL